MACLGLWEFYACLLFSSDIIIGNWNRKYLGIFLGRNMKKYNFAHEHIKSILIVLDYVTTVFMFFGVIASCGALGNC